MLPGVGIFGTGRVVHSLVPMLRAEGFTIKGIWGRTAEEAVAAARSLSIPFSTARIDEIVLHKEVDIIFVMCPPQYQSQITMKALGIGKHVVCNTPGGLRQLDVLKMVNAALYYPTLIALMNYGLRLLPVFGVTKQLLQGGFCGAVQLCEVRVESGPVHSECYDWTCDTAMGGGILSCLGAHVVDAVLFLTDREPHLVSGLLKSFDNCLMNGFRQVTSDSFCTFQMELDGGVCVSASLGVRSFLKSDFSLELFVSGTKGALRIRGSELYGKKWDADEEELLFTDVDGDGKAQPQSPALRHVPDDMEPPPALLRGSSKLVECLKAAFSMASSGADGDADTESDGSGRGPVRWDKNSVAGAATFGDGQRVAAVLEAVKQSNASKQWVPVAVLPEQDEAADRNAGDGNLSVPFYVSL